MPIPTRLEDWTPDAILDVLRQRGGNEGDTYEFKAVLNSRADGWNDRIRKAASSLSNSGGGFLIFGVVEGGTPDERLVGMLPSSEYSKELSDKLATVEPALNFTPQFHDLPDGNVVTVAELPRALNGPHSFQIDRVRQFWRRSQGTATAMTHQEIRDAFSNYAERRARIEVVYVSLAMNWVRVRAMGKSAEEGTPPAWTPDVAQIRLHLGDVHVLCPDILGNLFAVLNLSDLLSTRSNLILDAANRPLYNEDQRRVITRHCAAIVAGVNEIRPHIEASMLRLQAQFGFSPVPTETGLIPPLGDD